MSDPTGPTPLSRYVAIGVYAAYALGTITGFFWLVGLVTAYVAREGSGVDPLARSHLDFQVRLGIRLLVWGLVAFAGTFLLVASVVGLVLSPVPLLAWTVWGIVVSVRGMAALVGGRGPDPRWTGIEHRDENSRSPGPDIGP